MTIGRLARRVGLAPSAIRYYEARGLLRASPRLPNGYRRYDEGAVAALGFIRRAQSFGMTLDEVRELLRLAEHGNPPCARVREIARAHLAQVRVQIRELVALQRELARLLRRRSDRAQDAHICPLLEQGGGSHARIAHTELTSGTKRQPGPTPRAVVRGGPAAAGVLSLLRSSSASSRRG